MTTQNKYFESFADQLQAVEILSQPFKSFSLIDIGSIKNLAEKLKPLLQEKEMRPLVWFYSDSICFSVRQQEDTLCIVYFNKENKTEVVLYDKSLFHVIEIKEYHTENDRVKILKTIKEHLNNY